MDLKQNIKLGGSPEEVSYDFYNPTTINYISFFITPIKLEYFLIFLLWSSPKMLILSLNVLKKSFLIKNFKYLELKKLLFDQM